MSGSRKSRDSAFVPAANNVGRPPVSFTVEDAVKLVVVNDVKPEQAIVACGLQGQLPYTTLYYKVRVAREKGTYNNDIIKFQTKQRKKLGIVVDVTAGAGDVRSPSISPITMEDSMASSAAERRTITTMTTTPSGASSQQTTLLSTSKRHRKSVKQATQGKIEAKRFRTEYDERYKAAFKEATAIVASRDSNETALSVCQRLNLQYNLDTTKRLARSTIYNAIKNGLEGQSPKPKGPAPKIPNDFVSMIATHSQLSQVSDGELRGRDLRRMIGASMTGTEHENSFTIESVWRKVQRDHPDAVQAGPKVSIDDARAQWTTHDNLSQWFDDAKRDLLATGLVEDKAVYNNEGELVSELTFKKDCKRRIINMDETHHDLSITGEKGGPRAVTYFNPVFPRGATRCVKSSRHVTGAYATNSAGEVLPPFYIFDSSAKCDANFRVKVEWLVGLPKVQGRFGCPHNVGELDSFYAVRGRGSMDECLLNEYIESVILPLFPNMHKSTVFDPYSGCLIQGPVILKLDAGPGRIVSSAATLAKREAFFEKGLIIIMGLPNATSVQQEMDALYGAFKAATYARGEKVVQKKLRARGLARRNAEEQQVRSSAVLNLDFSDLATIVNGTPDDDLRDRPFDSNFSKEKILSAWGKVGFVPFNRKCLKNKKVRKELGQHVRDDGLEDLQLRYDVLVDAVEAQGFNVGIFDSVIPTAQHVKRAETRTEQVEELLKTGKAFSASGQWNLCSSRIGNAGVTLEAQKRQLELNEQARLALESKKNVAQVKTLEKAQTALEKYNADENSMNDKDWGDVVRWVLPAAKVDHLLKDLKRKEQILQKLASLPREWTTYVPPRHVANAPIPNTPVTTV